MTTLSEKDQSRAGQKKARTRIRNQARYQLRERINNVSQSENLDAGIYHNTQSLDASLTEEERAILETYLRAIAKGSPSTFSLKVMSSNFELFSKQFPTSLLSIYKIKTLCTSRFGKEYAEAFLQYKDMVPDFSMMEYAALLGEYGVLKLFLSAGISPIPVVCTRSAQVSAMVIKKFLVDAVPITLASYIAKSIFEMKLRTFASSQDNVKDQTCLLCSTSSSDSQSPLLMFSRCCQHYYCELCMWEYTVQKLNERVDGDVVRCSICNKTQAGHDEMNFVLEDEACVTPSLKRESSLRMFRMLPSRHKDVKKLPKKAKVKNVIYSTWREALSPTVGSSQDVRGDKFMRYVDLGATLHVRACLEAGVNVNMRNE
jgi:hypothetical protein